MTWQSYATYESPSVGRTLELRDDASQQHFNIGIWEKRGSVTGVDLKDKDAIDLAKRILKRLAPEVLTPEPFKPGDFVWRERSYADSVRQSENELTRELADEIYKVTSVEEYTHDTRRFKERGAKKLRLVDSKGQETQLASDLAEKIEVIEETVWRVKK